MRILGVSWIPFWILPTLFSPIHGLSVGGNLELLAQVLCSKKLFSVPWDYVYLSWNWHICGCVWWCSNSWMLHPFCVWHEFDKKRASQVTLVVKNSPGNAGNVRDAGSIPGSGRSPGVGNGTPLQYSCLEDSMGRGACWATVHGVVKSWARLSMHTHND